jgi:RNA polymerase sigma-32 factor
MSAIPRDGSAFTAYRAAVKRTRILSPEAEHELSLRFQAGDQEAGKALVEGCLSFVMTIAREYQRWGAPMEDLVQQGNLGLLEAARRFDPHRGTRLATYAAYWIRVEIREHVARSYRMVGLGRSRAERRALRLYRRTGEGDPAKLGELSGLGEARTRVLLPLLTSGDVRLDQRFAEGDPSLGERLPGDAPSPEEETGEAEQRAKLAGAVKQVVSELSAREQHIVTRRLLADEPETLEELGATFGVTRERVRQIEVGAKKRMRARLGEIAGELVALAS